MNNPPVDLDFSHKYDREHAEAYLKKHQDGLARKLPTGATSNSPGTR